MGYMEISYYDIPYSIYFRGTVPSLSLHDTVREATQFRAFKAPARSESTTVASRQVRSETPST